MLWPPRIVNITSGDQGSHSKVEKPSRPFSWCIIVVVGILLFEGCAYVKVACTFEKGKTNWTNGNHEEK